MTRKICHYLANWWLIICQSMLFTFWFGDDYACSKLLFITVQFPPSWYPKQQRACCCKPADGHLQSSAQLHFDIVEACEDKLMLISWRIWSLSFWRRPFMHEFTELPLLNKKRFFSLFWTVAIPSTPFGSSVLMWLHECAVALFVPGRALRNCCKYYMKA